jgi:hypothetical protein
MTCSVTSNIKMHGKVKEKGIAEDTKEPFQLASTHSVLHHIDTWVRDIESRSEDQDVLQIIGIFLPRDGTNRERTLRSWDL